ncbi:ABC-2 type transport system ATP-binding protein [Propionibacterium cyclohexanicum]|uniref:ABC-2 type transport system ATP-binding protein n=1 Tax=Propionibacterium cyclohexanicum TaxID=64702 RepID=A0A1H9RNE3_9ACTN|nr:ABC transporter ATP-binding protein [Propionibacterium cyclohexanicum]SER74340.1 ABC-2 type transport system ATP-binding protein [Propionibacterium cyclohexanicum]
MTRKQRLEPRGADVVVTLQHVTKTFLLRHTRSIKEAMVWLIRGRRRDYSNEFQAMEDINLDIRDGESVALMGFNGSGKSTTLKLISGVMRPDEGAVGVRGRVAGLIEVGAGFHPDLTGHDNVYLNGAILGMTKEQIDAAYDDILEFADIGEFINTEVKFYSSGMYLRLAFSVAVHTNPDVFLVDEILAVGDEPFQEKCKRLIRTMVREGKTLVIVSHDLDMVEKLCKRGIVMQHGKLVFDGPCDQAVRFLRNKALDGSEDDPKPALTTKQLKERLFTDEERAEVPVRVRVGGPPDSI